MLQDSNILKNIISHFIYSKGKLLLIFGLSVVFVGFNSQATSPFFIWEGCDSAIFKTMGVLILSGGTPYVDLFDHKGPVLYFINAIGESLIPGYSRLGIFFIQILSTFIVFVFVYKLANIFLSDSKSLFVLFLIFLIYSLLMEDGDVCEEWELVAVVPSLFYSMKFILSGYIKRRDVMLIGICIGLSFGFCVYIRPNDAVSQVGAMASGVLLFLLSKVKNYRYSFVFIVSFLSSFLLFSVPVISYFLFRSATMDLYYGLFGHNIMYADNILLSALSYKKISLLIFLLLTTYAISSSKYAQINFVILPMALFSWLLIGGRLYLHYFIILIPIITIFLILLFQQKSIIMVTICLVSFFSFLHNIQHTKIFIAQKRMCLNRIISGDVGSRMFYSETDRLMSNIKSENRDEVWNFNIGFTNGIYFSLFYHSGIIQCNRIPLYEMAFVDKKLASSDNIVEKKPLWVVLTHDEDNHDSVAGKNVGRLYDYFKYGYDFIEANYDPVARTDTTICDIELWRRRDLIDGAIMDEVL